MEKRVEAEVAEMAVCLVMRVSRSELSGLVRFGSTLEALRSSGMSRNERI